jgi:hypothetical protein
MFLLWAGYFVFYSWGERVENLEWKIILVGYKVKKCLMNEIMKVSKSSILQKFPEDLAEDVSKLHSQHTL